MVRYRRNLVPGGTYFFTVTLADRLSSMLVDYVDALRASFRAARRERPFAIDAIVVLPDHLHAILTLPAGHADFSGWWRRIKGHFSKAMVAGGACVERHANGELALWQRRFLGTYHSRRLRLSTPCRLHPLQPGEARLGATRS